MANFAFSGSAPQTAVSTTRPEPQEGLIWARPGGETTVSYDGTNSTGVTELWQSSLHQADELEDQINDIEQSEGVVVTAGTDNRVIAVDAETGDLVWTHEYHDNTSVFGLSINNGTVFSGGNDGKVIAADLVTGQQLWEHNEHGSANVNDVFAGDGFVISGDDGDPTLVESDPETGDIIQSRSFTGLTSDSTGSLLAVHADHGYYYAGGVADTERLLQLNPSDLTTNQSYNAGGNVKSVDTDTDSVYMATDQFEVEAIDSGTFGQNWLTGTQDGASADDLSEENGVVVVGEFGQIETLNASTGTQLWTDATVHGDFTTVTAADLSNGRVYTSDDKSTVIASELDGVTLSNQTTLVSRYDLFVSDGTEFRRTNNITSLPTHANAGHSVPFVFDGDRVERRIWVIANGASDPADAKAEDLIFEESA